MKALVPAHNCEFHLSKGKLTVFANSNFTPSDAIKSYQMATLHATRKKIKKPVKWVVIPPKKQAAA